ncbi:MAG TPA: hypothetical protein VF677_16025 [Flavobacterium sp.]|jgi:hypothetical protein
MRKQLLYFLIIILLQQNYKLQAQNYSIAPNKYNLNIKSPDASQFAKFVDIPTSTHTGAVGIDIPIYNIKVDDYNLPISLKYHASGIKVKEIASKVGLGWSLSVGGISLSKQIFGNEDEGSIPSINQADGAFQLNNRASNDHALAVSITGFNVFEPDNPITQTKRDTQPDIFSYSLGNISGDFYFDSAGKIVKIPETDIKIEGLSILTDNAGNRYFFSVGNRMRTLGGYIPSVENVVNTDFIVNKIILKTGKEIKFEYLSGSYSYLSSYYKGYTFPLYCINSTSSEYNEYASLTEMMPEKYLSKIIYPEGYVFFTYNNNREDIINGISLETISVYNKYDKLIANYNLTKNYFTSNDVKNISGYPAHTNTLTKRLKLNEVKNTIENSSYKLTYYEDYSLPNRLSDATDYVGYFNGQLNNLGIPYFSMEDNVYGWGDNKNPNINYALSGSLKEVIYPTGGKMKLEYELDDFNFDGEETEVFHRGFTECGNGNDPISKVFSVNSNRPNIQFKFTFNSPYSPDDDGTGSLPTGPYVIGELLDQNNNVLKQFLINKEYDFLLEKKPMYKIRFRRIGNIDVSMPMPCIVAEWYEIKTESKKYNKSVGGIRVKRINKHENSNTIIDEVFTYKDENNVSTGVFMGDPINYYYSVISPDGFNGDSCENLVVSNSGNFNLSTINGKPTIYDKVITERININELNKKWKTIDTYYNIGSTNAYNHRTPYQTFVNNQFARGLLIRKEIFNSDNIMVKKIENEYSNDFFFNQRSQDYLSTFPNLTIRPYQLNIIAIVRSYISVDIIYTPIFSFDRYEITSAWVKNKSTKITDYLNNKELEESVEYFYDNSYKSLNPLKQVITFPDTSVQETTYSYAHEKGNQLMIDRNMIGIPLETISTQTMNASTKILAKTGTVYPTSIPTTQAEDLVLPLSVQSYDILSNTPSTEVTYDKYDAKGNLQQYTGKDDIPISIVWGYNQTQPIAKVEGMTYEQLVNSGLTAAIVSASDSDALNPSNEPAFIAELDTFRKSAALAAVQVTTYTYDPLVGVTSITPPSGIREVYLYDAANRLQEIRENNTTGKLLKEFKYNYKP